MDIPTLNEVFDLWETDGSLRDIYFFDTTMQDWENFLTLNRSAHFQYSFDADKMELPSPADIFNNRDGSHTSSIYIGEVSVNCHFFILEEIELDIDPRQIKSLKEHNAVLVYIAQLAKILQKTAYITPENSPSQPILTFNPNKDEWTFFPILPLSKG